MNNTLRLLIISFIVFFLISCNDNDFYKSAEGYYKSGHFALARYELTKIKESNSDYKKVILLTNKIDSTIYQMALKEFSDNYLDKSAEILENIRDNSSFYPKKNILLKLISLKTDSLNYQRALTKYLKDNLYNTSELLESIEANSPFYTKKIIEVSR